MQYECEKLFTPFSISLSLASFCSFPSESLFKRFSFGSKIPSYGFFWCYSCYLGIRNDTCFVWWIYLCEIGLCLCMLTVICSQLRLVYTFWPHICCSEYAISLQSKLIEFMNQSYFLSSNIHYKWCIVIHSFEYSDISIVNWLFILFNWPMDATLVDWNVTNQALAFFKCFSTAVKYGRWWCVRLLVCEQDSP